MRLEGHEPEPILSFAGASFSAAEDKLDPLGRSAFAKSWATADPGLLCSRGRRDAPLPETAPAE
jgi:hypothetical protein